MKKNRLLPGLLVVVLMVFSFGSMAFAEEHMADTVVDIAVDTEGEFTILEAALTEAGLVETLQGEGPFTVFAPTDAAFEELLGELGIEAEDLLAHPQLEEVLLYHVVSGKVMSTDLESGDVETLLGESVEIDASLFTVNDAEILVDEELFDLEAENGVVHVINKVLVPDVFELEAAEEEEEDDEAVEEEEEEDEDVPATGDIGILPFAIAGAAGLSGLWVAKKRKE